MRDNSTEKSVTKILDELQDIRKKKRISHETLAQLTGLNRSTISLIESHKRTPTILTCLKIAKALDIKLSKIIAEYEK